MSGKETVLGSSREYEIKLRGLLAGSGNWLAEYRVSSNERKLVLDLVAS